VLAYVEQGDLPKFDAPFVLNKTKGREILARYSDLGAIDRAFAAVKTRWEELLAIYQAPKVPDANLRRMVNTWNQVQCMATFNLSRSTSGYETGIGRGMGYRDSNQDILGFVHLLPERARQRNPRHRLDPAFRRHLFPPVPAAHEEGQRRRRRRLQ